MKATATLTTLAALAVAGSAAACECSTKETKQLTAAPEAPAQVVYVGHDGDHGKSKATSKSMTFKVVINDDGEARYWVNGKEVSEAGFEKAKKAAGASVSTTASKKRQSWVAKAAPTEPTPPTAAEPKPRLGVVLGSVSNELAEKIDVDADDVILIERVIDGTPAAKAGLKSYDVLVEFDGEDDLSVEKLRRLIAKQGSGGEVEVIVIRNGDEKEIEVVFGGDAHAATAAPAHPRARFFAGQLDEDKQQEIERAMRLAEQYSAQAQKQAKVWAHKIESEAEELQGLGKKLALRYDIHADGDFEAAMEELHESLAELDIDLNFEFNFDEEDFPRMHFIELDDKTKNKAVILERKLHQEAERHARQNEQMQRQRERVERLHESMREKQHNEMKRREHNNADRHIEQLEARIAELEAMIEELSHEIKRMRPRGVRN